LYITSCASSSIVDIVIYLRCWKGYLLVDIIRIEPRKVFNTL